MPKDSKYTGYGYGRDRVIDGRGGAVRAVALSQLAVDRPGNPLRVIDSAESTVCGS